MPMPGFQNGLGQQNQFYSFPNSTYQQIQPQPVRPMIPGRMVNSVDEVTPNEVPMDGTIGVFVKNDLTRVYTKSWNADGTIRTNSFVPYKEEAKAEKTEEETLNTILARLNSIEKAITRNKPYKRSKEESSYGYDKQSRNESDKQ